MTTRGDRACLLKKSGFCKIFPVKCITTGPEWSPYFASQLLRAAAGEYRGSIIRRGGSPFFLPNTNEDRKLQNQSWLHNSRLQPVGNSYIFLFPFSQSNGYIMNYIVNYFHIFALISAWSTFSLSISVCWIGQETTNPSSSFGLGIMWTWTCGTNWWATFPLFWRIL